MSPVEYTKDSIFRDQNFVLIQQTLRFYDDLLSEILEVLFPPKTGYSIQIFSSLPYWYIRMILADTPAQDNRPNTVQPPPKTEVESHYKEEDIGNKDGHVDSTNKRMRSLFCCTLCSFC